MLGTNNQTLVLRRKNELFGRRLRKDNQVIKDLKYINYGSSTLVEPKFGIWMIRSKALRIMEDLEAATYWHPIVNCIFK